MSSIDLRNAAAVLRELAEGATSGFWHADDTYGTITAEPFKSAREVYDRDYSADIDEPWVISESDGGGGASWNNLPYLALMSPPVALALADWLDAEAAECDQMVTRRHERDGVPVRDVEREVFAGHPALAVASAILKARA